MNSRYFPHGLAGIIFDCDGVMIDSLSSNILFYNLVLKEFGMPPMTPAQVEYTHMATARQALEHIVPEHLHGEIDRVVTEKISYQRDIMPHITLMPQFREFMELLHDSGIRMAVHTNRIARGMQRVLDFFSLPSYFEPVVTASTVAPKPSPEGVLQICAAWQADPAHVLFVGDSLLDGQAARAAGAVFAAFGGDDIEADLHAADFAALAAELGIGPLVLASGQTPQTTAMPEKA